MSAQSGGRHRVVVLGGGFGGVRCCQALAGADVDVTLVDRRNFHLFQPLLYQVATGGLSPGDIAAPLRTVLKNAKNARVVLANVTDIDVEDHVVVLDHGESGDRAERVPYDTLVVATGASHSYFGKDEWERVAPGLKSIEDATEIRARLLTAFEAAELAEDAASRQAWLTFVIVGGGPTGVELAGAIGELARYTMRGEFRRIDPSRARILLVEGSPHILGMYIEKLALHAKKVLNRLGVEVMTGAKVIGIDEHGVDVDTHEGRQRIDARTVLWAAGVAGSPLGRLLQKKANAELDRAGRVLVEPDCTVKGHPEIFVIGDLAHFPHTEDKRPLPGVAPVAMQMGTWVGRAIRARLEGQPAKAFRFVDKGTMAVIGRNQAVARLGFGLNWNLRGFFAWVAWLFIHILYLVGYENRLLVAIQWANHYFTRNRGARLISPRMLPATAPGTIVPTDADAEKPAPVAGHAA
jgi:NADH:ubiquinone reductase (H+-translocating)